MSNKKIARKTRTTKPAARSHYTNAEHAAKLREASRGITFALRDILSGNADAAIAWGELARAARTVEGVARFIEVAP